MLSFVATRKMIRVALNKLGSGCVHLAELRTRLRISICNSGLFDGRYKIVDAVVAQEGYWLEPLGKPIVLNLMLVRDSGNKGARV
jgi:hypothetical protein